MKAALHAWWRVRPPAIGRQLRAMCGKRDIRWDNSWSFSPSIALPVCSEHCLLVHSLGTCSRSVVRIAVYGWCYLALWSTQQSLGHVTVMWAWADDRLWWTSATCRQQRPGCCVCVWTTSHTVFNVCSIWFLCTQESWTSHRGSLHTVKCCKRVVEIVSETLTDSRACTSLELSSDTRVDGYMSLSHTHSYTASRERETGKVDRKLHSPISGSVVFRN